MQKPITGSTTARLYQLRSKKTISPGFGQVLGVALEVPLTGLALGRLRQRGNTCRPGVEVLHEAPDGATLARGVAPLEEHGDAPPGDLHVTLELHQLDLEPLELLLVTQLDQGLAGIDAAGLQQLEQPVGRDDGLQDRPR